MAKVLIIEDNENLRQTIQDSLESEKFVADAVADGEEGLAHLKLYSYDVAIVDWELPKLSGIELCSQYRSSGGKKPILMLTGRTLLVDKLEGLTVADDYLTKPFDMPELIARVRALLRRSSAVTAAKAEFKNLALEVATQKVTVNGKEVKLLPKEFQLLEFLMRHPEDLFTQESLLDHVWSSQSEASNEAIRSCVKRLRKKLEDSGSECNIKAVYGSGYKIEAISDNPDEATENH